MHQTIAQIDIDNLTKLRANIECFMQDMGTRFARPGTRLLDIAPQDHKGAKPFLPKGIEYHTLDIDPNTS